MGFINRLSDYFFAVARYANYLDKGKEVIYRNSKFIFRWVTGSNNGLVKTWKVIV